MTTPAPSDPYAPPRPQLHLSTILLVVLLVAGYMFLWTIPNGRVSKSDSAYGWPLRAIRVFDSTFRDQPSEFLLTELIIDGLLFVSALYLIVFLMEPSLNTWPSGRFLAIFSGCTLAVCTAAAVVQLTMTR